MSLVAATPDQVVRLVRATIADYQDQNGLFAVVTCLRNQARKQLLVIGTAQVNEKFEVDLAGPAAEIIFRLSSYEEDLKDAVILKRLGENVFFVDTLHDSYN